jgi:hypothetical protein
MIMSKIGRFDLQELTISRLTSALSARLSEIPHLLSWAISSQAQINKTNLRKFKDIFKGKRCFIVANGPSLKHTQLELLADEITFGLNRIYLNFDQSSFRPSYQVIVNDLIIDQCVAEIAQLSMPKFLNWNRRSLFQTDDSHTIFLKSKMVVKDIFQSDITRPMVFGATVTFVALQLAYYMGFTKVILIGLDHSYTDTGVPSRSMIKTSEQDVDHFNPNYFPKGFQWQLPDLLRSEIDFTIAKKAFEDDGREILDATIGGKCHIFKKVDFLSLFNEDVATR